MKIFLDSNIWQIIVNPDNYLKDPFINEIRMIRQLVLEKRIEAFISETIFSIEAIKKKERKNFYSKARYNLKTTQVETESGGINLGFSIGPQKELNFEENPLLERYFQEAIELGLNIVKAPRIGGVINEEVEKVLYKHENFDSFFYKLIEVSEKIECTGGGITHIESIGFKYDSNNWRKGIQLAPESESKKIAMAAAEWADGDSVATSVALKCDYFCTRDKAKNAGSKSVMSEANLNWLKERFGFQTILPQDLITIVG